MALRGEMMFVVHFEGKWVKKWSKYSGGRRFILKEIDGDELCYMDMVKDVESNTGINGWNIQWVRDGILCTIHSDADLMEMWDKNSEEDGQYHIYLEKPNGPTSTPQLTPPNKGPTTPKSKCISPTVASRKSPRLNKGPSGVAVPLSSTPTPQKPTPTKRNQGKSLGLRRSDRIQRQFQFQFSNNPDEPLLLSDYSEENDVDAGEEEVNRVGEDAGEKDLNRFGDDAVEEDLNRFGDDAVEEDLRKVSFNVNKVRDDLDWAFNNLLETTFQQSEQEVFPSGNNLGLDKWDNLEAEERYYSAPEDNSGDSFYAKDKYYNLNGNRITEEEEVEKEVDTGDNKAEEVEEQEGIAGDKRAEEAKCVQDQSNNRSEGQCQEFVDETDNLFQEEDGDRFRAALIDGHIEELHVNMEWPTMGDCRKYLRKYALAKKFEYKQKQNNNLKIDLVCKDPGCSWRVYVRRKPKEPTAMVRSYTGDHTCKCEKEMNSMAKAGWVAGEVQNLIRNHKDFKPKDVQAAIWMQHGVKVSYHTAYYARIQCNEVIHGSYSKGYQMVPKMARQLLLKNPGSVADWYRDPNDKSFHSFTIAYKASLDGFINGCRPILGLDGSFLKRKYGGVILSIVSLDGNNGLFPIAICICRSECYDSWSRFLRILAPYLLKHKFPFTFISDRQKGLIEAVTEVFSEHFHRYCFRHMYKNFKNDGYKGPHLEHLSWGAAKSYKKEDHDLYIQQLTKDCIGAKLWLDDEHKASWARSYFDHTSKCEHITNNFSESFNKMILGMRDLPLVKLVENYQMMLMTLLYNRRQKGDQMDSTGLVPRVEATIDKLKMNYNKFTTAGSTDYLHVSKDRHGHTWTVDLNYLSCSCCEWQISGIPCVHAIGMIIPRREPWLKYCSPFFDVSTYRAAYDSYITPMEDPSYWPKPQHTVEPPFLSRPPGRPRVQRRKDADELIAAKMSQKKCSKCGKLRHNKVTCKGTPATDEQGRRVRPRIDAEGPSGNGVENGPAMMFPSMPVPRTRDSVGGSNKGKRKKHTIYDNATRSSQPFTPVPSTPVPRTRDSVGGSNKGKRKKHTIYDNATRSSQPFTPVPSTPVTGDRSVKATQGPTQ